MNYREYETFADDLKKAGIGRRHAEVWQGSDNGAHVLLKRKASHLAPLIRKTMHEHDLSTYVTENDKYLKIVGTPRISFSLIS